LEFHDMDYLKSLIASVRAAAARRLVPATPMPGAYSFAGQHTNPRRNAQRKKLRSMGRRQYRKARQHAVAAGKPWPFPEPAFAAEV
jgi:hypothetical protein